MGVESSREEWRVRESTICMCSYDLHLYQLQLEVKGGGLIIDHPSKVFLRSLPFCCPRRRFSFHDQCYLGNWPALSTLPTAKNTPATNRFNYPPRIYLGTEEDVGIAKEELTSWSTLKVVLSGFDPKRSRESQHMKNKFQANCFLAGSWDHFSSHAFHTPHGSYLLMRVRNA